MESQQPAIYKQGEVWYEPPGIIHKTTRNPDSKHCTLFLAVIIGEQGWAQGLWIWGATLQEGYPNTAFFYCMLISFFLFETFKEDVLEEVLPVASYATTVRRKVVDFAAKIITTSRGIILKVTQAVMDNLRFDKLWEKCQNPIPISG